MTPYETASLAVADGNMLAAIIAAAGIWFFGLAMLVQNWSKAKDAADDRKVTQGMLAALTELVRRTSPPSSQDGPRPGPAE